MNESKQQCRGLHPYTVMCIILVAMLITGVAACQSSGARNPEGSLSEGPRFGTGPGGGMAPSAGGPPPDAQSGGGGRGGPPSFPGSAPAAARGLAARKGGSSVLEVEGQSLELDLSADRSSSIALVLRGGSTWTGSINADRAAKAASLSLEGGSRWIVTADSCLTTLSAGFSPDGSKVLGIEGNGHTLRYDAKANPWLGGGTYALEKGGRLLPY